MNKWMIGLLVAGLVSCNTKNGTNETNIPNNQLSMPEEKSEIVSQPVIDIDTFTVNGVSFTMVYVEGDRFDMGATPEMLEAYENEKPAHEALLGEYWIGRTEVTQALWQAVMEDNPSKTKGKTLPVDKVSWDDVQQFISKLNTLTGEEFRLPSEAEWEFAARGGKLSKHYSYSGSNNPEDVAWFDCGEPHPVSSKQPNELGIYDMSGNVWEWCNDWYDEKYYETLYVSSNLGDMVNPKGPKEGTHCVLRGGSWGGGAQYCRCSCRAGYQPNFSDIDCGFRLASSRSKKQ